MKLLITHWENFAGGGGEISRLFLTVNFPGEILSSRDCPLSCKRMCASLWRTFGEVRAG